MTEQQPLFDPATTPVKQPDPCPNCGSRARLKGACTSCGYGTTLGGKKRRRRRKRRV